jgi:predicted dehydrogenase
MARRIRLGMVGGGQGAFVGAVHRIAARLDDQYELVAGALSSDPARSGDAGCTGDIGTHAFNLAEFVTGLRCVSVAAELTRFVAGRALDDNAQMLMRFSGGARGMLWSSQVAPGNENALRLRVYGEKAGLDWSQEQPNALLFTPLGEPPQLIRRAGSGASAVAAHASRIPAGHPEGYLEAFAQYRDVAEQISARREAREPDPASLMVPGIADGVRGMRFITAAVASSRANAAWTAVEP